MASAGAAVVFATASFGAQILAVLATGVTAGHIELLAKIHQLFEFLAGDFFYAAELTCIHADLCVEFDFFHNEHCLFKVATNGERTVVLKKECIVVLNVAFT